MLLLLGDTESSLRTVMSTTSDNSGFKINWTKSAQLQLDQMINPQLVLLSSASGHFLQNIWGL